MFHLFRPISTSQITVLQTVWTYAQIETITHLYVIECRFNGNRKKENCTKTLSTKDLEVRSLLNSAEVYYSCEKEHTRIITLWSLSLKHKGSTYPFIVTQKHVIKPSDPGSSPAVCCRNVSCSHNATGALAAACRRRLSFKNMVYYDGCRRLRKTQILYLKQQASEGKYLFFYQQYDKDEDVSVQSSRHLRWNL